MPTKPTQRARSRRRASGQLTLEIQRATRAGGIPADEVLGLWARAATERDCSVTLRLVGREEGRSLNRTFRGRDYATNVLTFVYETQPELSGDIAICAPVVTTEARRQGKAPVAHWAHLVVHGLLHLQGYDHETPTDASAMERRETQILRELGYPDPYLVAA